MDFIVQSFWKFFSEFPIISNGHKVVIRKSMHFYSVILFFKEKVKRNFTVLKKLGFHHKNVYKVNNLRYIFKFKVRKLGRYNRESQHV